MVRLPHHHHHLHCPHHHHHHFDHLAKHPAPNVTLSVTNPAPSGRPEGGDRVGLRGDLRKDGGGHRQQDRGQHQHERHLLQGPHHRRRQVAGISFCDMARRGFIVCPNVPSDIMQNTVNKRIRGLSILHVDLD